MWISDKWIDYSLLDASDGERLEGWGKYTLVRPDPQIIWKDAQRHGGWKSADAIYRRSAAGGGGWTKRKLPEQWTVSYGELKFLVKAMGFKHTGLFPEQACNWDWFSSLVKNAGRPIKVLNLFAYTGGATVAAAAAGASVCHVDAARGIVSHARENARLSNLLDAPIRYIVDDCKKFLEREIRRGNRYEGIIMDPPSYGRGPSGEVWKIEDNIDELITLASRALSDRPLFFLLNSYTTGLSPLAMRYILELRLGERFKSFNCEADELALPVKARGLYLPCGSSVRCTFDLS